MPQLTQRFFSFWLSTLARLLEHSLVLFCIPCLFVASENISHHQEPIFIGNRIISADTQRLHLLYFTFFHLTNSFLCDTMWLVMYSFVFLLPVAAGSVFFYHNGDFQGGFGSLAEHEFFDRQYQLQLFADSQQLSVCEWFHVSWLLSYTDRLDTLDPGSLKPRQCRWLIGPAMGLWVAC
nr:MAG TPA: hypothetical protein [Caudoviricetes sp.]